MVHSRIHRQLAGRWRLAGIGWPQLGWCFSVLPGLSSSRRPVWACSQGGCGIPREHVEPKSILRSRLGNRLSLHHHHHFPLAKAARVLGWRHRLLNERSSKVILSRAWIQGGRENWDFILQNQFDPALQHLEKEMATHCSILAWKIPWTEKPGGLQSMGAQSRTCPSD